MERTEVYRGLAFPRGVDHPTRRPYTVVNMVCTVDGKVVVGGPGTTRLIGSPTDHYLMAKIEFQADAVLLGAGLIREDDPPYPRLSARRRRQREAMGLRPDPLWVVLSASGAFPRLPRLFAEGQRNTALITTDRLAPEPRALLAQHTQVIVGDEAERTQVPVVGEAAVDVLQMGRILRDTFAVNSMVCLGGPVLNASMLAAGAADELFVTVAPKLQGGSRMPTLLEGKGYPPEELPVLDLLSLYSDGSDLFLRYRLPSGIKQ
ncbi:MAG: RibD family protein [Chloroflexota bacterium]